jgi:type IX secretion system PorP/SprF family membrane protein
MKKFLPLAILALLAITVRAQQLPLYTQYIFNPYMVNPAMVASSGQSEVNGFYRNQWTGIQNGPKTLQFDVQVPLTSRMAIGANVANDRTILLDATSVMFTYGYRIPLATDHTLGFGLSAGIFTNKVNLNGIPDSDINDPALSSARLNNSAADGQFGVHYTFKNFVLGFSMVNLFERKTLSPESFQNIKFSQLKNDIIFASYKFEVVPGMISVRPNFAYRLNENQPNFYEASALVSYKDLLDVGGGYRQNFGPSAMVRINLGNIQAGFAYDFPSPTAQVSTGGSQEIQLKWRFGEKKTLAPRSRATDNTVVQEQPQPKEEIKQPSEESKQQPEPAREEDKPKEEPKTEPVVVPEQQQPVVEEKKEPVVEQKKEPVVTPPVEEVKPPAPETEYYLIINTFEDRDNAEKFYKSVIAKGFKAEIRETPPGVDPHYFYVHLPEYKSKEISVDKVLDVQKKTGFKDAWFKKMD